MSQPGARDGSCRIGVAVALAAMVFTRIRGAILMACSNEENRLVLATGNKSELSVGYCTLYGDTVGGLAVLVAVAVVAAVLFAARRRRR